MTGTVSTEAHPDDLIVIAGAGGFIAGHLTKYFRDKGHTRIRAVDKKPVPDWYQPVPGVERLSLDLSVPENCERACEGAVEVYNLAADMGGMGFIEHYRVECMRSVLITAHMLEAAYQAGAPALLLLVFRLRVQHAAPARSQLSGFEGIGDAVPRHGRREKLYWRCFCQEYWAERA